MKKEENPSAFKHWFNKEMLLKIAKEIGHVDPSFDQKKFVSLGAELSPLEMKPRVLLMRDQLRKLLPADYKKALKILLDSLKAKKLSGFELWPYTEFVQTYGLEEPQASLKALSEMTQLFTAEFAVRPFLIKHEKETLKFLLNCADHKNVHLRRWASEGSRPRLPWGAKLHHFIKNPQAALPILEKLKFDEELYVRKSVSNHLNDITKDHPDLVIQILARWKKQAGAKHKDKINWIINRSLRTLIKAGHPKALELIGASSKVKLDVKPLKLSKNNFKLNEHLEFEIELISKSGQAQRIVVDYIIHFMKANQKKSPKVFKLKTFTLDGKSSVTLKKRHHLKKITTMVYYPGEHLLEVQINGQVYKTLPWKFHL